MRLGSFSVNTIGVQFIPSMSDAFNWRSPTQVALASALWVVSSGPHLTVDLKGMTMNKNYRTLAALSVLVVADDELA